MTLDVQNFVESYEVAVIPDTCGLVNNQWWHKHLERKFDHPVDALAFAERILKALEFKLDCPCGEGCAFNSNTKLNPTYAKMFDTYTDDDFHND